MYKRIIIKIGTKVLTKDNGEIDEKIIESIVEQIVSLRKRNIEVVLVTSGAVGSGRSLLKLAHTEETIADKQVFAAIGQVALMDRYAKYFKKHEILSAQVLVTKEDFRDRSHYFNMRNCFLNLLRDNVIPIVNENDVIAVKELVFTDNDELAGLVSSQLDADAIIILTSVDGVLKGDPKDPSSELIPEIDFKDTKSIEKYITPEKTSFGRGGMLTKFAIAKKLVASGITVYMANGKRENIIINIIDGKAICTKFIPHKKTTALKRRIAYSDGLAKGTVFVNKCTEDILLSKDKIISLLPVGIVKIEGGFFKGDVIEIKNEGGHKIGYGIAQQDSKKVNEMAGKKGGRAVIHYDYMFID